MTLLESDLSPELEELKAKVKIGYEMTIKRDNLNAFLSNQNNNQSDNDEAYSAIVADYLNALQENWYENDENIRYDVINNLPKRIKVEAELLFDSVEPIESIAQRLDEYTTDQISNENKLNGISPYPRATSLVMLDIIDEYR